MSLHEKNSSILNPQPEKLLAYRVLSFSQQLYRGIELLLESRLGLSVRQWRVLFYLASYDARSVQDIAAFWKYDKSQVSRAVRELVLKDLVVSRASPIDRRSVIIELTPQGWSTYERGLPLSLERQDRILACVNASELNVFENVLDRLTHQAERMLSELLAERNPTPTKEKTALVPNTSGKKIKKGRPQERPPQR